MQRGGRPKHDEARKEYEAGRAAGGIQFVQEHQRKSETAKQQFINLFAPRVSQEPDAAGSNKPAAPAPALQPGAEAETATATDIEYPPAPKAKADRENGKVYLYEGLPMRWHGGKFLCTCDRSSTCRGNQQASRCRVLCAKRSSTNPPSETIAGTGVVAAPPPSGWVPHTPNSAFSINTRGVAHATPNVPRSRQASKEDLKAINKYKLIIPSDWTQHHREIKVVEDGSWDKSMLGQPQWAMSGRGDSAASMPLRLGASWVVEHSAGAARVVEKDVVYILIEIGVRDSNAYFTARDYGAGPMGRRVAANSLSLLEKMWFTAQPLPDNLPAYTLVGGRRFTGVSSSRLAEYFRSITEGFKEEVAKTHRGVTAHKEREEMSERTHRRDKERALTRFVNAMDETAKELGGTMARDDVFQLLLESKIFAPFAEQAATFMNFDERMVQRMVQVYDMTTDKGDKRALLSVATPLIGIERSMALFKVTEYECRKANLYDQLRTMPKEWQGQRTVCRIRKDTVAHLEGWVLHRDNVLRAAHGNHGVFQLQRMMNRSLLYIKYAAECDKVGVEKICRSKFYLILSEKIFRDTTRETCCCVQCVQWGDASFELLRGLVHQLLLDAGTEQQLLDAIENEEHFYKWSFKGLLRTSATEAAQCMTHALSQQGNPSFRHSCSHEHDQVVVVYARQQGQVCASEASERQRHRQSAQ